MVYTDLHFATNECWATVFSSFSKGTFEEAQNKPSNWSFETSENPQRRCLFMRDMICIYIYINVQNILYKHMLLMEDIRLTSWYVEYSLFTEFYNIPGGDRRISSNLS